MESKISRRCCFRAFAVMTIGPACFAQEPAITRRPANENLAAARVNARAVRLKTHNGVSEVGIVVTAIAAHPTGEWIAVAGDDHQIRIMETSGMTVTRLLQGHRDLVRTLAFDRSGGRLASAGNDGQVILWDADADFRLDQRVGGTSAIARLCFSPHGDELAAVGFRSDVQLMGEDNLRRSHVLPCECRDLRAVAFRGDNKAVAVGGRGGHLHLFDPRTGQELEHASIHQGRIHDTVFQPDSNLAISVGEDGIVSVFDSESRTTIRKVKVTTGKLFAVALIDSQRVAAAGSDNAIHIVNTDSGVIEHRLEGHRGSVSALATSGGMLFSGGYDATVRRWAIDEFFPSRQRIAEAPGIDR